MLNKWQALKICLVLLSPPKQMCFFSYQAQDQTPICCSIQSTGLGYSYQDDCGWTIQLGQECGSGCCLSIDLWRCWCVKTLANSQCHGSSKTKTCSGTQNHQTPNLHLSLSFSIFLAKHFVTPALYLLISRMKELGWFWISFIALRFSALSSPETWTGYSWGRSQSA